MRKVGILIGIVAGVFILAVVSVWFLADPNRHRETIQTQLQSQLGREVTLGKMTLGLWPLRFQVSNPRIGEDANFNRPQQPFIQADKLDIQVRLLPLLSGTIHVDSLELTRPKIELIRSKAGKWNFTTLGSASATAPQRAPSRDTSSTFALNRLRITDGQIGLTDLQQSQSRAVYDHIDLSLQDYASGKPFSFDVAANLPGEGSQEVRFKGRAGPIPADTPALTPLNGKLNLKDVGLAPLMQFVNSTTIKQAKGIVNGESQISSESGTLTALGKLQLDGAQVNGLDIGYPIRLNYNLASRSSDSVTSIQGTTLQLGSTALSIDGSVNSSSTPAKMDLKIKSGDVSIAEVARLASAFGVAFAPGTSVKGTMNANLAATGSTTKPVLTGTIAGRDLNISGQGIPRPVQIRSVRFALSPTSIQSDDFTATSGDTNVGVRFSVRNYSSPSPSADLSLRSAGATLPEIQSIAKAYGITGLDQVSGQGALNFDLRTNGTLQSLSSESVLRALNGTINLDFSPLKIAGFDTVYKLGGILGFASNMNEQKVTDIVKLTGQVLVKNGVAQGDNVKMQLPAGILTTSGTADLVSENLNLKAVAVFPKSFIDKVGGARAGGVMSVAFSNSGGDIVLPTLVTGTFTQPKFAPDVRALAELQKQRLVPSVQNIIGALKGKTDSADAPEQPAEGKRSVFRGLLDRLGGKKAEETK